MQGHGARASYADRGWKEALTEDPVCSLMTATAPRWGKNRETNLWASGSGMAGASDSQAPRRKAQMPRTKGHGIFGSLEQGQMMAVSQRSSFSCSLCELTGSGKALVFTPQPQFCCLSIFSRQDASFSSSGDPIEETLLSLKKPKSVTMQWFFGSPVSQFC